MNGKGTIALIAGTRQTKRTLVEQLETYLGKVVEIISYSLDEGIEKKVKADLVILSTHLIYEEALPYISPESQIIIARRTINYSQIDPIFFIPAGTDVLLVNDVKETTFEAIESLKTLGIDHLNFIPYYPGIQVVKKADIAITMGEIEKVPGFVEKVINIGGRLIDMTTMTEILKRLNILDQQGGSVTMHYLQKIIDLGKKLARSINEIGELNKYLNRVLDSLNDGILAFNDRGEVNVCNENIKRILKIENFTTSGRNISTLIRHDKLLAFLLGDEEERQLFKINGQDIVVHRMYNNKDGSIIATFKNANETIQIEKRLRNELLKKGYVGKYTFDDIIGESSLIIQAKEVAKKLARTDSSVLIEGESGTGKELFASAIHNASPRRAGPFLAVNFSALPDDLVESELFGYEEGAFTGAKKGGKAGLFEQACGGTIFLDEIGDISLKVQARLLRVLQEKEIMRVGGTAIIPVDVRVVAATNKDLVQLIEKGEFREDLYHRLKVLYLKLPPLRNRKEDIRLLFYYFLKAKGGGELKIHEEVYKQLEKYDWYGNIRELENTVDYMLAVRDGNQITVNDLPADSFFQHQRSQSIISQKVFSPFSFFHNEEYMFLLKIIYQLFRKGERIGRQKLAILCRQNGLNLTENQIRYRLNELEAHGLIVKQKGKYGTRLTDKGLSLILQMGINGG